MTAAISIENLSKTYSAGWRKPSVAAIRDVSLQVEEGEAFGFIGPNGAGKSTAIKILTGVLQATSGRAAIFGINVGDPGSRFRVGYVPENPYLFDYLTPLEILLMAVRLHGLQLADPEKHCLAWLERLELASVSRKAIRSFSKGMTQRVALAQALAVQSRLLILDEPLSGLDPIGRRDVVDILSEYKRDGGTLFFTSHVLHDVERLADRFGLIHRGKLRAVQSPAELSGTEEVVQVRSAGLTPVPDMVEEFSGRWVCAIPRSQLWGQLEQIKAAGHSLLEIKPSLSLEAAFLRAVGRIED